MKIAITYDVFTQQSYGGISRYFVKLIRAINHVSPETTIQIFGGFYINQYLFENIEICGIKVHPIKYTGIFRRSFNKMAQNLWLKWKKPEIIHQSYYSESVFNQGARVVLTVPDMIHEFYPDSFSDSARFSIFKKKCCDRADKIIAISNATKNDLINVFGIDSQKIEVIYLANPLESIEPDMAVKTVFSNYILYVGERHGYKNFDALVRGYAGSKEVRSHFNLVCFGGGAFSSSEEKTFKVLGIRKKVHQINGNDQLLALYYRKARALVYPSLYEGFGMPPLEAMKFSCPVICSNTGSIPEIVGSAGIYFNPENSDDIQLALENTLFDKSLIENLVRLGKDRHNLYSWDRCARETLEVYRALAN